MPLKPAAMVLLLSVRLLWAAESISSATYGIELPVPEGWTSRVTDSSLTVSSNQQVGGKTVVIGVQFSPNLSPYSNGSEWREKTMYTLIKYLESSSGRLLTPNSKGVFLGDSTEQASYLAFEYKTGTLFAGHSRFLAHQGKGYEFFIMGDTLPIYTNFTAYANILETFRYTITAATHPSRRQRGLSLRRISSQSLLVESDRDLANVEVFDARGASVPMKVEKRSSREALIVLRTRPSVPLWVRTGGQGRPILP